MDTLENEKGNTHFDSLLGTCLTQLFTWCHKQNDSNTIALFKLFILHEDRNSMNKPKD